MPRTAPLLHARNRASMPHMPDIVLATLNAKYIHASFGLRYLMANLGELRERACLLEFVINQQPLEIVEALLRQEPRIIGFGVYIWNITQTTEVVAMLKKLRPDITIILGGPEVSYETEQQEIVALADHVITGEADLKFAEVCRQLLDFAAEGQRSGGRGGREGEAEALCASSARSAPRTVGRTSRAGPPVTARTRTPGASSIISSVGPFAGVMTSLTSPMRPNFEPCPSLMPQAWMTFLLLLPS